MSPQSIATNRAALAVLCAAEALLFATAARGQPLDRVDKVDGSVPGKVVRITPEKVVVRRGNSEIEVDVREIEKITFSDEPRSLSQAQTYVSHDRFAEAIEALQGIDLAKIDAPFIKEEIQYLWALAEARHALQGNSSVSDAGRKIYRFLHENPNHYHFFAATEILGDLLAANKQYDKALTYYQNLATAPWVDMKARSQLLTGGVFLDQKKFDQAQLAFDEVLKGTSATPKAQRQRLLAMLGKARTLAATDDLDGAVRLLHQTLNDASAEDTELAAQVHNALGQCHLKSGAKKEALLAFLHVDLLYRAVPDAHAESLFHLVQLWKSHGKPDRAREARELLQERYSNSRWAK